MKRKTVGERIREARKQKGLTMAELSELVNISQGQLSNYEKDRREPAFSKMARIADVFEISLDWFALGLEEEDNDC